MRGIIITSIIGFLILSFIVAYSFENSSLETPPREKNAILIFLEKIKNPLRVNYKFGYLIYVRGYAQKVPAVSQNYSEYFVNDEDFSGVFYLQKRGLKWRDFFNSQSYFLSQNCLITGDGVYCNNENETLKFFLNGNSSLDLFDLEIKDADVVLITYAEEDESNLTRQIESAKNLLENEN